jgi:acyl-CoA thioester hydrolase
MSRTFTWQRRIEFRDTDAAGIAHFSTYFTMMEQAEHAWLRELGFSVVMNRPDHTLSWPRVAAECDYQAPLRFEEVIDIEGRIVKLGRTSVTYEYRFLASGKQVAIGRITAVCCRVKHGERPIPEVIPTDLRERLADFVATSESPPKHST